MVTGQKDFDPWTGQHLHDINEYIRERQIAIDELEEFKIMSTWGKPGDKMKLDIDRKTHQAWTGEFKLSENIGAVARFKKKYGTSY